MSTTTETDPAAAVGRRTPLLCVRDVRVGYDGRAILPPVSFEVRPGDLWALVGRNGSGKSTLLRTVLGLQPRLGGTVRLGDGVSIGYVPQRALMDLSVPQRVVDAVRSGLDRKWSFLVPFLPYRERDRVHRAMRDTDTLSLARRQIATLSEGQKQRVLLAGALADDPLLLVLDEPTSSMDQVAECEAFDLLDRLRTDRGLGVVVVAHHLSVLAERATHLVFLDGDDDLVLAGPVDEVAADPEFLAHHGPLFTAPRAPAGSPP